MSTLCYCWNQDCLLNTKSGIGTILPSTHSLILCYTSTHLHCISRGVWKPRKIKHQILVIFSSLRNGRMYVYWLQQCWANSSVYSWGKWTLIIWKIQLWTSCQIVCTNVNVQGCVWRMFNVYQYHSQLILQIFPLQHQHSKVSFKRLLKSMIY